MGHSVHFLQRLNRVKPWHAELALALYRDAAFVREVLYRVRVPEQAERIALCLDDEVGGPHLIVTRRGDFVTCLGEGMTPYDVFTVPQRELDAIRDFKQIMESSLSSLMDGSDDILKMGGGDYFLKRLLRGAHLVNRSDMLMLRRLSPLIAKEMIIHHAGLHVQMSEMRKVLIGAIKSKNGRRVVVSRCEDVLRNYWCNAWAHNHISTLFGVWGHALKWEVYLPRRVEYSEDLYQSSILKSALWTAARAGSQLHMIRAAWGVSHVMPLVQEELFIQLSDSFYEDWELSIKTMLALAARVQILSEEELRQMLSELARHLSLECAESEAHGLPSLIVPEGSSVYGRLNAKLLNLAIGLRRFDAASVSAQIDAQHKQIIDAVRARRAAHHKPVVKLLESLGEDDAFIHTMFIQPPIATDSRRLEGLIVGAAFAMRREHPEQLYFEDTSNPLLWPKYSPQRVLAWLDHDLLCAPLEPVQHQQPQPGRNDPCPCGSGKKYKKCCQRGDEA